MEPDTLNGFKSIPVPENRTWSAFIMAVIFRSGTRPSTRISPVTLPLKLAVSVVKERRFRFNRVWRSQSKFHSCCSSIPSTLPESLIGPESLRGPSLFVNRGGMKDSSFWGIMLQSMILNFIFLLSLKTPSNLPSSWRTSFILTWIRWARNLLSLILITPSVSRCRPEGIVFVWEPFWRAISGRIKFKYSKINSLRL